MKEIWKFYKETNNNRTGKLIYQVSNLGRVMVNGVIKTPRINKEGYYVISTECLHRVVATLFIPNPDNKPCIDHINTIKTDNRVENLRWVTWSENTMNPITVQRKADLNKGKNNPMYGRKWMTNGSLNKVVNYPDDVELLKLGWRYGRV